MISIRIIVPSEVHSFVKRKILQRPRMNESDSFHNEMGVRPQPGVSALPNDRSNFKCEPSKQYHHTYTFMPPVYLREHLLSFFEHVMNDDSSENYCYFRHCRSYNYGILWKQMCYSPGIVNQGRRFICPVHCGHFRHR